MNQRMMMISSLAVAAASLAIIVIVIILAVNSAKGGAKGGNKTKGPDDSTGNDEQAVTEKALTELLLRELNVQEAQTDAQALLHSVATYVLTREDAKRAQLEKSLEADVKKGPPAPLFDATSLTELLVSLHVSLRDRLPWDRSPIWQALEQRLPSLKDNQMSAYKSTYGTWFPADPPKGILNTGSNCPLISTLQCLNHLRGLVHRHLGQATSTDSANQLLPLLKRLEETPAETTASRALVEHFWEDPDVAYTDSIQLLKLLHYWLNVDVYPHIVAFCGTFAMRGFQRGLLTSVNLLSGGVPASLQALGPVIVHVYDLSDPPEGLVFPVDIKAHDLRTGLECTFRLRALVTSSPGHNQAYMQKFSPTDGQFVDDAWYAANDGSMYEISQDRLPLNTTDWPDKPSVFFYVIDPFA
jgi:hypothetical protein